MSRFGIAILSATLLLTACNRSKNPDETDLKKAIDNYLQTHGKACAWVGQSFPVEVSDSRQASGFGVASKMAVLEQAGLVQATETVVTVPGMLGGSTQRHIRRYQPTAAGQRYMQTYQVSLGQSAGFCYGIKRIDSIVNWTQPNTLRPDLQTEATFTYKIPDLAPWAQRTDIQNQFPEIHTTITGISKTNQTIGLEFTNGGWIVPSP